MTRALILSLFLATSLTTALAQGAEINWMSVGELEAAQAKEPRKVMIDVYTKWCGPCKMIAPVLDDLDGEMGERIDIRKMNIDENPNTPMTYGIRSIPTLLLIKDGEVKGTKVGAVSKGDLKSWIEATV